MSQEEIMTMWERIMDTVTMLRGSLIYLWLRFLDIYTAPVPEEWLSYTPEQIIEWCKQNKLEWESWRLRMDKIEAEFPTRGIEEEQ